MPHLRWGLGVCVIIGSPVYRTGSILQEGLGVHGLSPDARFIVATCKGIFMYHIGVHLLERYITKLDCNLLCSLYSKLYWIKTVCKCTARNVRSTLRMCRRLFRGGRSDHVFLPVDCIEYFYGNENGQSHGHGFGVVEYLTRDSREHPGLCGTLPLVRLS